MSDPITGSVVVYESADNQTRLELRTDNTPIPDHSQIDRCVLTFSGVVVDSDVDPGLFDLTEQGYLGVRLGTVGLRLGQHHARVHTYDALHTNGIVWDHALPVLVR